MATYCHTINKSYKIVGTNVSDITGLKERAGDAELYILNIHHECKQNMVVGTKPRLKLAPKYTLCLIFKTSKQITRKSSKGFNASNVKKMNIYLIAILVHTGKK